MDDLATYYDVLEIAESASHEDAQSAYRRLVMEYHPDRLREVPTHLRKLREDAKEKWQQIQDAWAVLGDPVKRRQYDDALKEHRDGPSRAASQPQAGTTAPPPPPSPSPPPSSQAPPRSSQPPPPPPPNFSSTAGFSSPAYNPAPTAQVPSGFGKKAAIVALILMAIVVWSLANRNTTTSTTSTSAAPEQIVDRGVCPYELCKYGERWLATQSVDVYVAPPDSVGVSVSSLRKQLTIKAGSWVRTETGIVLAKRHEGRIDVNLRPTFGGGVVNAPQLTNGQIIALYSYLGEGCWRSWIGGRLLPLCSVNSIAQPQNEWWVQIRTAGGTKAWANSAGKAFVSEEGLNSALGEKIADDKVALPEKLTQIDALLKEGANLNRGGGQYGTDPMRAAITTNDIDLFRALMSRGLTVRNGESCPIYSATQGSALRPGGDAMLDFLLESGMKLDCLQEPPLHAFLRFGIATANYPVDQAIRVAEVLVRHGANVNQRDSQGKSIFDVLDQAKEPSRVIAFREALTHGAIDQTGASKPKSGVADPTPNAVGRVGGPTDAVYRVGGGVSAPTVLSKTEPEYSAEARRAGLQGAALVQLVVDEGGTPRDLQVIRSLGLGLDEKATAAIEKWRFKPGMKEGHPVAVLATIEVNFRLPGIPFVGQTESGQGRTPAAAEIAEGRRRYGDGEYKAALAACDRALSRDPGNADATKLRTNIVQTMGILGIQ